MSAADAICWCAGDIRCPHSIAVKLPKLYDEMEQVRQLQIIIIIYQIYFAIHRIDTFLNLYTVDRYSLTAV